MSQESWQKKIYQRIEGKDVAKILSFYGIAGRFSYVPLYGGWRKACFLLDTEKEKLVLTIYPLQALEEERIISAIRLEQEALKKGLPCRKALKTKRGNELLLYRLKGEMIYVVLFFYLPGQTVHPYREQQIQETGKWLAKLHRAFENRNQTLIHGDFARGNLFFNAEGKLCGIIDFEEARWGEAEEDIKITMDFLFKDCLIPKEKIAEIFKTAYENCQ
ncbi:MAG TPA: phosphotransferase [Clostridia bacterium]|nr:phosphotransferase [Clostridia bacterium]